MNNFLNKTTLRLEATFYDFDGNLVDPSLIKIIFYDYKQNLMSEHIVSAGNKISIGKYYYDHAFMVEPKDIVYYEWYAEINGKPSLTRDKITFSFT